MDFLYYCTDVTSVNIFMIPAGMSEKERLVMKKLEDLVDKQRDEIRAKDHELTVRNEDVEAVSILTMCINKY